MRNEALAAAVRLLIIITIALMVQRDQSVAGIIELPGTGQNSCWDQSGNPMLAADCFGTGQDGDKRAGMAWPNPRFTDNLNGTVTDNLTGLIWLQSPGCAGNKVWADAMTWSNTLASGSCSLTDGSVAGDWRLPNARELESLLDLSRESPALPFGHPFSNVLVGGYTYWSSTSRAGVTSVVAWFVNFVDGSVSSNNVSTPYRVWAVRGGQ